MTPTELMEQGIRAYTRGQLGEAERCWRDVLATDPSNARALSYLELLVGKLVETATEAPKATPVPLPAPREVSAAKPAVILEAPTPIPLPSPAPARSDGPAAGTALMGEPAPVSAPAASPWDRGPVAVPTIVLGDGEGLDLKSIADQSGLRALVPEVTPSPRAVQVHPRNEVEIWMEGARELFALGDFSGSLEMIEKILRVDPAHAEARQYLSQNEATLIAMYESKLGPPDRVPRLAIKPEEVLWLNLDHRAGFLLAQVDGTVSYEDLFALSGLPRLDTARILAALLQEGVITS